MRRFWRKLLCRLDLHDWQMTDANWDAGRSVMECSRCDEVERLRGKALAFFIRINPARRDG